MAKAAGSRFSLSVSFMCVYACCVIKCRLVRVRPIKQLLFHAVHCMFWFEMIILPPDQGKADEKISGILKSLSQIAYLTSSTRDNVDALVKQVYLKRPLKTSLPKSLWSRGHEAASLCENVFFYLCAHVDRVRVRARVCRCAICPCSGNFFERPVDVLIRELVRFLHVLHVDRLLSANRKWRFSGWRWRNWIVVIMMSTTTIMMISFPRPQTNPRSSSQKTR